MTPEEIMPWLGVLLGVTGIAFAVAIVAAFIKSFFFD